MSSYILVINVRDSDVNFIQIVWLKLSGNHARQNFTKYQINQCKRPRLKCIDLRMISCEIDALTTTCWLFLVTYISLPKISVIGREYFNIQVGLGNDLRLFTLETSSFLITKADLLIQGTRNLHCWLICQYTFICFEFLEHY